MLYDYRLAIDSFSGLCLMLICFEVRFHLLLELSSPWVSPPLYGDTMCLANHSNQQEYKGCKGFYLAIQYTCLSTYVIPDESIQSTL